MKLIIYIFLYLNIYTAFFFNINAQNLHLSFKAKDTSSQLLLDSLNTNSVFKNYLSLKNVADSLHYSLETAGYIENEMVSLQKKNDSNFIAFYFVGPKYKSIKLYYSENDFSKKELLQVSKKVMTNLSSFLLAILNPQ